MSKVKLSIIIVHYKVKKVLFDCIKSIYKAQTKTTYEIIVVDNDEKKTIEEELKELFPKVEYVKSLKNNGFGAGNNLGERYANGEFLFFLSPDTKIFSGTIDGLVDVLEKNKNAAIVAPIFLDKNNKPYPLQGTKELTFLRGVVALSFLNKLFPNNPISREYWLLDWDKKNIADVDVVPGTAFVIRKHVFEKIGGFDESFFLYFEESDLCRRVKMMGYKIYINPHSRIFHIWGASTKDIKTFDTFSRSRFWYFRKHFGFLAAVAIHIATNINLVNVLLAFVFLIASFLRFYRLSDLMEFIGDQALFYLPARDIIIEGVIPLVGPQTSHPWIHHGAIWTYVLSIILWVFNFNPVPPAYFIAILGVVTVWLFYKVVSELFDKRIALIAAFLYAASPLIVLNARMPYHTSPIPFFAILLFFAVYRWIKGNAYYFPLITFLMGVLYNHELTTFVLSIPIFCLFLYGFFKKERWVRRVLNIKIIIYSVFSFLVPMIPFIIYDISNGYKQTAGFIIWVLYRIIKFPLNIAGSHFLSLEFFIYIEQLIFASNLLFSLAILIFSLVYLFYLIYRQVKNKNMGIGYALLFLYLIIPIIGLFAHRIPIEADVLLISPFIIMMIAVFLNRLFSLKPLKVVLIVGIGIIITANSYNLFSTEYLTKMGKDSRISFKERLEAIDSVIKIAGGRQYNLVGRGALSEFPSFTMNYEYLLWRKGHPLKKGNVDLKIVVWERDGDIIVYKKDIKNQRSNIKNTY